MDSDRAVVDARGCARALFALWYGPHMRLLVTGGAGYIGTHLIVDLLAAGHEIVVVDNFSTGHPRALARAERIGGRRCTLLRGDVGDRVLMRRAMRGIDAVFHLAAFKDIGGSVDEPERFFLNNVGGMAVLLWAMQQSGVRRIVYASSAAVYGTQSEVPISEDAPLRPESPYGVSKVEGERMLEVMARLRGWSAVSLRFFNPVGAHPSGLLGEPPGSNASLVPRALLAGEDRPLTLFGTDYPTPDGTGLRDYIHICDLSRAHLAALDLLHAPGHQALNIGTGRPHSVREVLAACAAAVGHAIPVVDGPRRLGDVAVSLADPRCFERSTGFRATLSLTSMVDSTWTWLNKHRLPAAELVAS
ncbi:MAG: UDP-glucose 4-epimerase [Myxococcota bacterium]|jgi:UDP-glucose 4-epimerase